ncbi:hypothetical protein C2S53_006395 [Perilla frutescens var. hirtella]|uniref:DUF7794 domain-containing protein n=1 Tax=Perilla frutescens var. hirtella TaxID=608512 RepID=A0AAD4JF57_PERFH|nr:hypothetical protein C2S51_020997 [Perilla frutescens var. frutescens]KAH6832678.1 hypothetical protein C2S53_006395 [Perilla frutescens var. hirtella]
MESHRAYSFPLLLIISLLSLHSKVIYGDPSVLFLDSPTRPYLRRSSDQTVSLSPSEIGATASVLLGFAPPSTLTAASSSKLNEVLVPNPFDRPRAMFMVEVAGAEDSQLIAHSDKSPSSNTLRIMVEGNQRVDIQLPDEDEISIVSLNEASINAECSDKELSDFASWLGGSYVEDASQSLNGELLIPIANGAFMRLHMSERADRDFATSLVLLISNMRKAIELHQVLTKSERSPAELITGRFDGIKVLQDHYGKEGIAQSGMEVFVNSISKMFESLQAAYQGQIVGVIAHRGRGSVDSEQENMFHITVNTRSSARWLQETELSPEQIKIAEILFVRTTLAWITGIILLIATLLGIYFLLGMPITKDTLLYSNIKLD